MFEVFFFFTLLYLFGIEKKPSKNKKNDLNKVPFVFYKLIYISHETFQAIFLCEIVIK